MMINNTDNKRKYTTRTSPRYPCDDYDIVFATNKPHELFITEHGAFENYRFTVDPRKSKGKYDLCLTIDGKKHRLHQLICNPSEGFEVDHIGGNTHDIRRSLLREATHEQNMFNRRNANQGKVYTLANGKYLVRFPKIDTSDFEFDTYAEALACLYKLQDEYYGEFSYRRSQEIAAAHETYLFHPVFYVAFGDDEIINEIESEPFFKDTDHEYVLNDARIQFRLLNAEYQSLYHKVTAHIENQLVSADADERTELLRTLNWLEDGRYVIDLPYFQARFIEIMRMHLSAKRH